MRMGFSETERKARRQAIRQLIKAKNMQAIVFVGDMNVGHSFYGDFRYFADNHISFQRQVALAFADSDPILFIYSFFSKKPVEQRAAIKDVRTCSVYGSYHGIKQIDPIIVDVPGAIKERGITKGRIGINLEILPVTWYEYLKKELPEVEWMDFHEDLMEIRFRRSPEELDTYRKGAALGVAGFEAALKIIRPGVTEYQIAAEIEYAARQEGAGEHFTLIGSGKFAFGDSNTFPLPVYPSERRIEPGDSVVMEITPRYQGYWTQFVRMVNVGKPNQDLIKMQTVAKDALEAGLEQFRPGKRINEVVAAMKDYVDSHGFVGKPPFGHICGVDLVEQRVAPDNDRVIEPGSVAILHPMVFTKDGKNVIFWGQTYIATSDGYERLHRATDEILTV
jgi:Xaa-Pro aminopeptidase